MPRDTGTCTRVPFHINTTRSSDSWTCNVFLDRKYTYHKGNKITTRNPFGPWVAYDSDRAFSELFATLNDPQQLELVLRRAQMALLNPCNDPKYYYSCAEEEIQDYAQCMEVRFSLNIVRIEIHSDDVRQVSLYDLPGIFAQTADGETELPRFVHNLVKSYVLEANNIILLVIPMNNDRDNCHAGKLVQGVPLALDRTIGVLTKPDRMEAGIRLDSWLSVLAGKTYVLGHGYYITRQPSPDELKHHITRTEAAENENDFFSTSPPWTAELKVFEANFGAPQIQAKLGELLVTKIKSVIPQIDAQIKGKLRTTNDALAHLPPLPGDKAMHIVYSTINKIEQDLFNVFSGNVELELYQNCRKLVHDLSQKLSSISPALRLPPPMLELSSDDEMETTPTPTPSKGTKRPPPSSKTTSKTTPAFKRSKLDSVKKDESTPPTPNREQPAITYTINDIRAFLTSVDITGIPGAVDPRAMKRPVSTMLDFWELPIVQFIDQVNDLIRSTVATIVNRNLAPWATTPFAENVRTLVTETLEIVRKEILNDAQKTLYAERSTQIMIFDSDNAYFDSIVNQEMGRLEKLPGGEVLSPMKMKGLANVKFMPELDLFCQIKAYLSLCNMSLTRHLGKHVLSIFSEIKTQIVNHFHNKLGLEEDSGDDVMARCQALLEEDQQRAGERIRLEKEKRKWEAAQKRLQEVMHE